MDSMQAPDIEAHLFSTHLMLSAHLWLEVSAQHKSALHTFLAQAPACQSTQREGMLGDAWLKISVKLKA